MPLTFPKGFKVSFVCSKASKNAREAIVHLKEQVAETYKDGWKSMMTEQIVQNKA